MHADRLFGGVSLAEIVPLEHPRDRICRREPDDIRKLHLTEPLRVIDYPRFVRIENLRGLFEIGLAVFARFLERKLRPRFAFARRVAYHRREIADDENRLVSEVLKLAKFMQDNGMADMQIRPARVAAQFHLERFSGLYRFLNFGEKFILRNNLDRAPFEKLELLFCLHLCSCPMFKIMVRLYSKFTVAQGYSPKYEFAPTMTATSLPDTIPQKSACHCVKNV